MGAWANFKFKAGVHSTPYHTTIRVRITEESIGLKIGDDSKYTYIPFDSITDFDGNSIIDFVPGNTYYMSSDQFSDVYPYGRQFVQFDISEYNSAEFTDILSLLKSGIGQGSFFSQSFNQTI